MRINVFIAKATGLSRRASDQAVQDDRVTINDRAAQAGEQVSAVDKITLDGHLLTMVDQTITLIFNKPAGYVVSRNGQGSQTIYDLLPRDYRDLKPVGRLDKDSSGLLLLTNDGQLANQLTHPRYRKTKIYEITLDKPLTSSDKQAINQGIELADGKSALQLEALGNDNKEWRVSMSEGRNRQIRRTFAARGYTVFRLHRTSLGKYLLPATLQSGSHIEIPPA